MRLRNQLLYLLIFVVALVRGHVVAFMDKTLTSCTSSLYSVSGMLLFLELIYLHDCVTDRSVGSNRYLNVTFYNHPTDRGRNNKTLCDCLLSLFISLHKHCCVRGNIRMQGYIFLSCHDLLKLIAGVTPSQRTRRQPEPNTDNTFDETTR